MPSLISCDQVGYIKGRFIGENVRIIEDILSYTTTKHIPGLLILIDFEKAFDTVEWNFLFKSLKSYNIGSEFISWVKLLYNNITSCTVNNGHLSPSFELTRGVRQGCLLSAFLFILASEVIALYLKSDKSVKGIKIAGTEYKICQLADDTTIFLENLSCLEEAINHFNAFQKNSGLKLNMEKTVIIPLGPFRNTSISLPDWLKELRINLDFFQTLGIWFSTDALERTKRNFDEKLRKVEAIIQIWKQRNLSWKGRIVIIKSLILSQFTHLFSMLYTPPYVLDKLKKLILNFLWNNKPSRVKYETMIANIKDGGLKLPDITSFHNAQKIFWIKRLQTSEGKWKKLFFVLSSLNCLLLDHKLQVSDISTCEIGSFHHQVLNCWYNIKSLQPLTMIELYNEYVFMNKYILVNNAPLTPRVLGMSDELLNLKIIDLLDEEKS